MWGQKSSGAVPFGTLFALCFLWFGISMPLVFIGSYFGYKKPAPEVLYSAPMLGRLSTALQEHECMMFHFHTDADAAVVRYLWPMRGVIL